MKDCHRPCIDLLETFLNQLEHLDYGRALEVAAGDGMLTKDLLKNRFNAIDCFDHCIIAVRKLEELQRNCPSIERVD